MKKRSKPLACHEIERTITEYYSKPDEDIPPPDGDETKTHIFKQLIGPPEDDRLDEQNQEKLLG